MFVKLEDKLAFTILKVQGFKYKMWDVGGSRMITLDRWQEGFTKKWSIETEKGTLDLSNSQFSQCLVAAFDPNTQSSNVTGKKFTVKTNGMTGKEVRYWFTMVDSYQELPKQSEFNPDEIPM